MELDTAMTSVEVTAEGLLVRWSDGSRSRFHALWLRDNCPSGGDKRKAFRTFSMVDLNPELFMLDAEQNADGDLMIEFSDGHESVFDLDWLHAHCPEPHSRFRKRRTVSHFAAGSQLPEYDLPAAGSEEHSELLDAVARWGVTIVNAVPTGIDGTEALAALVGRIRETDFGRIFDIVVEPEVWEFSQTGLALDPHTDDPYRYTPSGTSILHCVEANMSGGESILVDGFAVAESMLDDDPAAFDLLAEISVPFVRHRSEAVDQGEDVHLLAHAPVITLDRDREVAGIRYHERSMAPFDIDPNLMGDYYRALIDFSKRINDPANAIVFRLEPGQAIVYDNQRVLHGRTAFSSDAGRRHLRLCTIDRDQFHSRLRRLREDHHRPDVDERLARGSV
ncbi:MAG: TauD/TfdA family dioxygenase [Acidimicrobiales bacterium]